MNPEIWKEILKNEGGWYTRDGVEGGTYKGIAWQYNQEELHEIGIKTVEEFKSMTDDQVIRFYSKNYLPKSKADQLPDNLAYTHLDFFINKWTIANKTLQELCNDLLGSSLEVDGILGQNSMGAISIALGGFDDKVLCDMYNLKRMKFYHELCQNKRKTFGYDKNFVLDLYASWLRRCRRLV